MKGLLKRLRKNKKGFTLIELIVVIAIIGVLAAILIPSMMGYVRNARITTANANAKQVAQAAQTYLTTLDSQNVRVTTGGSITGTTATGGQITTTLVSGAFSSAVATTDIDDALEGYLGTTFNGNFAFSYDENGSITRAVWTNQMDDAPAADVDITDGLDTDDNVVGEYPVD